MRDVLLVGATEQPNGDRIPVEMDQNGKDMDGVCFFESIGLIDQLPDEDETLWYVCNYFNYVKFIILPSLFYRSSNFKTSY